MDQPKYKLYYWPLPFRGSFISYYMAYNKISFVEENSFDEIGKLKNLPPQDQSIPFMGPPVLVDLENDKTISQMPAILMYLAGNNFNPITLKIIMDCNDLIMEIVRYNGSHMWEREKWVEFRSKRLPRWMEIFEESLNRGHLSESKIGPAETSVLALFGNMLRCLPDLNNEMTKFAPRIKDLCYSIAEEANLKKFIENQKEKFGNLYCGGQIEESIREMLKLDNES